MRYGTSVGVVVEMEIRDEGNARLEMLDQSSSYLKIQRKTRKGNAEEGLQTMNPVPGKFMKGLGINSVFGDFVA